MKTNLAVLLTLSLVVIRSVSATHGIFDKAIKAVSNTDQYQLEQVQRIKNKAKKKLKEALDKAAVEEKVKQEE